MYTWTHTHVHMNICVVYASSLVCEHTYTYTVICMLCALWASLCLHTHTHKPHINTVTSDSCDPSMTSKWSHVTSQFIHHLFYLQRVSVLDHQLSTRSFQPALLLWAIFKGDFTTLNWTHPADLHSFVSFKTMSILCAVCVYTVVCIWMCRRVCMLRRCACVNVCLVWYPIPPCVHGRMHQHNRL